MFTPKEAIQIIYYLLSVDGKKDEQEMERFDQIASQFDPLFSESREELLCSCERQINKSIDESDYYDVILEGVDDVLVKSDGTGKIKPLELVWNLIYLAHSEGEYSAEETKLIRYIVRKLSVEKNSYLELENLMNTLIELDKQKDTFIQKDLDYLTLRATINEIDNRQNVIVESIKYLVNI